MSVEPAACSSGNLLADRRYGYAEAAYREGEFAAAADLAAQTLELVPDYAAAHALLGRARAALGRREEAAAALRRALAIDPADPLGVGIELARLGSLAPERAITRAYVRALFDEYAPRFERHLVRGLGYRAPELICDALRRASSVRARPFRFRRALDLGCGTGLMAKALQGLTDAIEGVDLSPRMLRMAERTRLYDGLHEGDLLAFVQQRPDGGADLAVAADVFVYLACLDAVFAELHRALARGGLFAFTVQAHDGAGVVLGEDSRYAHSEPYLRQAAARAGFAVVRFEHVSTREERGEDVPGYLAVLER
jgi:predicted TPR repeat methyltransferase